jgi:Holliday junction DNA helicase RuvA
MIASLRGVILEKDLDRLVLECGGVGYEVHVTASTAAALPPVGAEAYLAVVPSFGMYGGGETLYGFSTASEKQMFLALRDNVPGTGAKKALEYLDKANKSLPDFRRAILDKDEKLLTGVFGFTKKTAEKLVDSLKDKLEAVHVSGAERIARADQPDLASTSVLGQALSALSALGYKPAEARAALQSLADETARKDVTVEQVIRLALKRL